MNQLQQKAIDSCLNEICSSLMSNSETLLSYLQMKTLLDSNECQAIINRALESSASDPSDRAENDVYHQTLLVEIFHLLKRKSEGWEVLIKYCQEHQYSSLVDKLKFLAGQESEVNNAADTFVASLVDFYKTNNTAVETFDEDGDSKGLETVWVDLQLEGESQVTADYNQIFVTMEKRNCRLCVIIGQPGVGKTTLTKKIAFDWAMQNRNGADQRRFDVVLAVPFRALQGGSNLLELVLGYFLNANGMAANVTEVAEVYADLQQSKRKVLIILDGLDEYKLQSTFPLNELLSFAEAQNFYLVITSRPYAYDLIAENIVAVKYEIVGFTEDRQLEFLNNVCKTELGRERAAEYLHSLLDLNQIAKVPILLLLICSLCDQNVKIPTRLTGLYETFVQRMLMRSFRKGSVSQDQLSEWRKSELVTSLGRLALFGLVNNSFQFDEAEMKACGIETENCFASGLLLYKSDLRCHATRADFAHRSLQEFLAAVYLATNCSIGQTLRQIAKWSDDVWPNEEILEMSVECLLAKLLFCILDSQCCRFYFGLLSGQAELRVALEKGFHELISLRQLHPYCILHINESLIDCSFEESREAGQILNRLINKSVQLLKANLTNEQLQKESIFTWNVGAPGPMHNVDILNIKFLQGFKLNWLHQNCSFSIEGKSCREAKVVQLLIPGEKFIEDITTEKTLKQLEQIDFLTLLDLDIADGNKLTLVAQVLKVLPPCRTCLIAATHSSKSLILRISFLRKPDEQSLGILEFLYLSVPEDVVLKLLDRLQSRHELDVVLIDRPNDSTVDLLLEVKPSITDMNLMEIILANQD